MTISEFKAKVTRRQRHIEIGDAVWVGNKIGYVVNWTRQPAWCSHEWNIKIWVPALARDIWKTEVVLVEAA